jgi:uncharacterized Zn finger protein
VRKSSSGKSARKCSWCHKMSSSEMTLVKKRSGDVREIRCTNCGKVLGAYLVSEGDFMSKIRALPNQ